MATKALVTVKSSESTTQTELVQLNQSGIFKFNREAIRHIGFGLHIIEDNSLLIYSLFELAIGDENQEVQFTREEISIFRQAIEARLTHCENEKEKGCPAFNIESYINMKLLLLDLREWLSVQPIVVIKKEQEEILKSKFDLTKGEENINYVVEED